eukprot:COSAG02_NODE_16364_length_1089_cov_21.506061_2_plen_74_part_01
MCAAARLNVKQKMALLTDDSKDDKEELATKGCESKVMDKVKTLQKMESDATDEAIHLASGYANVIMAKKQASML